MPAGRGQKKSTVFTKWRGPNGQWAAVHHHEPRTRRGLHRYSHRHRAPRAITAAPPPIERPPRVGRFFGILAQSFLRRPFSSCVSDVAKTSGRLEARVLKTVVLRVRTSGFGIEYL